MRVKLIGKEDEDETKGIWGRQGRGGKRIRKQDGEVLGTNILGGKVAGMSRERSFSGEVWVG